MTTIPTVDNSIATPILDELGDEFADIIGFFVRETPEAARARKMRHYLAVIAGTTPRRCQESK